MNKCSECGKPITNPRHWLCYDCWQKQHITPGAKVAKFPDDDFDLIGWVLKYLDRTGVRRGSHMTHWKESNWTTWGILIFILGGPLIGIAINNITTGFIWGAIIGFIFFIIGEIRTGY